MSTKDRKSKQKRRGEKKWREVSLVQNEKPKKRISIQRDISDDNSLFPSSAKKRCTSISPPTQCHHEVDRKQMRGAVSMPSTSAVGNSKKRKYEEPESYSAKRPKYADDQQWKSPAYDRKASGKKPDTRCPETAARFEGGTKQNVNQFQGRSQRKWKIPPPEDYIGFAGKDNELSNFYPCQLKVYGRFFGSTEHAYQWSKAICMGNYQAADKIIEAAHAGKAKRIANQYFRGINLSAWIPWRIPVMKKLLRAKARCCKPFRDTLRNSGERFIAEVVPREYYWGIGDGTGANVMGKLLMELRQHLDDALSTDPGEDGKMFNFAGPPPQDVLDYATAGHRPAHHFKCYQYQEAKREDNNSNKE